MRAASTRHDALSPTRGQEMGHDLDAFDVARRSAGVCPESQHSAAPCSAERPVGTPLGHHWRWRFAPPRTELADLALLVTAAPAASGFPPPPPAVAALAPPHPAPPPRP